MCGWWWGVARFSPLEGGGSHLNCQKEEKGQEAAMVSFEQSWASRLGAVPPASGADGRLTGAAVESGDFLPGSQWRGGW